MKTNLRAKRTVGIISFLIPIIGELLIANKVITDQSQIVHIVVEGIFLALLAMGIIILLVKKDGWGVGFGRYFALVLFCIYAVYAVVSRQFFESWYEQAFVETMPSTIKAILGIKLIIVMVGIIAGIPVAPKIDNREYSRRLRQKTIEREAMWTKESIKGTKSDLKKNIEKYKENLSEEELKELIAFLQTDLPSESEE
ncbi:hypothetical protein [Guggenheimella bovis]